MKLFIVGAGGQLGTDLAAAAEGHEVEALGRAELDVTDAEAVAALGSRSMDLLVNCSAYNDTAGAESDPSGAFELNARAPEALARAAHAAGATFVHVSTDYVFDGRSGRPYRETDPPAPLGVYGASKLTGEARAALAHPGRTFVVRTASLFGVAAVARGGNFVETMLRLGREVAAGKRDALRVVDDVTVSLTGTEDLARAILELVMAGAEPGLYHIVNRGQASWYDFARAILARAGLDAEVVPVPSSEYPSPVRRPRYSVLDGGKAEKVIGPLPGWEDALDRYLAARAQNV